MKVRRIKESDLEIVLSLWNRTMRYDQLSPELFEEKVWDDKNFSDDLTYVVEHEGQLIGFIMGVIRPGEPEPTGYIKMLVIDARFQRKGIGGRLLKEMEKMLLSRGTKTIRLFESAPNYLFPGLDVRYTRAMVFFEKNGYERFGETFNMEVDLKSTFWDIQEQEKALIAQGWQIRRAEISDLPALESLLSVQWPAWLEEVRSGFHNQPISVHLAFHQKELAGFSAYDCNNKGTGWFGPMGTLPDFRRKGIGGVLLLRCLHDLQKQGHRFATIPWVGPIGFYVHYAGAEISRVFYRYQKVVE